mmetsp:Transcript_25516/g.87414  ORF Transcript_25516/g.87414 Transcript_25516/m.87414 type:complete len:481 (-) Transcript_25516:147-1589(-)
MGCGTSQAAGGKKEASSGALTPYMQASKSFTTKAHEGDVRDVYDIGSTIGTGGYAVVKKAVRKSDKKVFAVKIMRPDPRNDGDGLTAQDIIAEIEILQQLEHPSILNLEEYFLGKNGQVFIITELLKGGELLDAMLNLGSYTEDEARLIMKQLLEALAYMHKQGVTHRDLKLENLLLAKRDDISSLRVADFGLAKALAEKSSKAVMETTCGSPMYVAPEVIAGKKYTPAVDVWSAGVILYILLTGAPPFDVVDNEPLLFRRIMDGEYHLDTAEWSGISKEVKDLVANLMCVDVNKRLTVQKALQHPWMTAKATKGGKQLPAAAGALKAYAAKKKLPVTVFYPGDFLVHQGERGTAVYLIRSGKCEVVLENDDPKAEGGVSYTKVAERGEGDFIGEMAVAVKDPDVMDANNGESMSTRAAKKWVGNRRTASVRALSTVECMILGKKEMQWVLEHDSAVSEELHAAIEKRKEELRRTSIKGD